MEEENHGRAGNPKVSPLVSRGAIGWCLADLGPFFVRASNVRSCLVRAQGKLAARTAGKHTGFDQQPQSGVVGKWHGLHWRKTTIRISTRNVETVLSCQDNGSQMIPVHKMESPG
jgi:hypothetical protein